VTDSPEILLRLPDGTAFEGAVVDLRGVDTGVSPAAIQDAIRAGCPTRPGRPTVHAPSPTRVHRYVCHLTADISVDRQAALAAVGGVRGVETPHDAELSRVKRSLRELSTPTVDDAELRAARRRAAEAGSETDRLRERVATLRGRVAARRGDGNEDGDDDALAEAEASLSEATRNLSEASTERVAAKQRLAALEERARQARDAREERLRLEDRAENLRRARRAAWVDAVESDFHDVRGRIGSTLDGRTGPLEDGGGAAEGLRDALAIAAIAPLRAPVVVDSAVAAAVGGPDATAALLDAPLVIE
jgi:hypothetical protein